MKIKSIGYECLGPFIDGEIEFSNGLNVLTGTNGSGKSLIARIPLAFINAGLGNSDPELGNVCDSITDLSRGKIRMHLEYIINQKTIITLYQGAIKITEAAIQNIDSQSRGLRSFKQVPDSSPIVYISAQRGEVFIVQQGVVAVDHWRAPTTGQRFGKIRYLMDMVFDQNDRMEEKINQLLNDFFPNMVTLKKVRNKPSSNVRATDVISMRNNHELNTTASGCIEILFIVAETAQLKDSVIIIDEPELHLHPNAQDMMSRYLNFLTTERGGRNQVIIATHSLSIIYGANSGRVINLRREDDKVRPEVIIDQGHPDVTYEGAITDLGYSRDALKKMREFHRDFKNINSGYSPPDGAWVFD